MHLTLEIKECISKYLAGEKLSDSQDKIIWEWENDPVELIGDYDYMVWKN